jgi:RHS repeat-associated protein
VIDAQARYSRYYETTQGRFTSPDPFSASAVIADPQTFNRYAYCRNNPVNSTDPTGMSAMPALRPADQERKNNAQAMGEEGRALIAGDEARYEQYIQDAVRSVGDNTSLDNALTENVNVTINEDSRKDGSSTTDEGNGGDPQNPWDSNSIMVIIWGAPDKSLRNPESLNPDEWLGHLSMITMQDDTSLSWDGTGGNHIWSQEYSRQSPSSDYTNVRSKESAGTGYVLDFGSKLNAKFQEAMKHAYDGIRSWDPYYHNCTYGFAVGFNAIADELHMSKKEFHNPASVQKFIKEVLLQFKMGEKDFPNWGVRGERR